MLKNYLKIALRNLWKHKGYSFINIAGLTMGLAACLVIFQYVAFEYSFDRFHENADDIYRILQTTPLIGETIGGGGDDTPFPLGPALAEEVPEVVRFARLHPEDDAVVSNPAHPDRVFEEKRAFYTDAGFLEMFTFPLVAGDTKRALEPGAILLSESMAQKYFGTANPIGKVLEWRGETEKRYRVTGVFQDVPHNSHLQFDFLLPMDDLLRNEQYRNAPEGGWIWNSFNTYVQLHPDVDRAAVERKMTELYTTRNGEWLRETGRTAHLSAQPLRDVHLNAEITARHVVMGSYRTVYFFTVIGLITLVIALLNYVNLATARSLDRAREIGVRKAVGARRRQLIGQFLFESALANGIAAALAVLLAVILTPLVNDLAGTHLTGALWMNPRFWLIFLLTFGVSILLAGLYPAFVLSSFDPVPVMRGKTAAFGGQLWLRKGFVVLQFAASFVLAAGTAVVYNQLGYMQNMDLGVDLEQVLTVEEPRVLPEGAVRETATATFVQELRRLPSIRKVATSEDVPGQGFDSRGLPFRRAADDQANTIHGVATSIDTSFADLYGLELVAGKGFSGTTVSSPEAEPWPVVVNETAVKNLGFDTPTSAVNQPLVMSGRDAYIIGVFKDFNWTSAHVARQNIAFRYTENDEVISLRVDTGDMPGTIAAIEQIYTSHFPGNPFSYSFVDEQFDQQYREDRRFATLFTGFAGLAILIACLGLFGLASFTAKKRKKEIGIRKVLGASTPNIMAWLSGRFLKLVLLGIILATPLASLAAHRWLDNFAYRVDLGASTFLLSASIAVLIAFLTVSYQSINAALTNPADSLRYE